MGFGKNAEDTECNKLHQVKTVLSGGLMRLWDERHSQSVVCASWLATNR